MSDNECLVKLCDLPKRISSRCSIRVQAPTLSNYSMYIVIINAKQVSPTATFVFLLVTRCKA